MNRSTRVGCVSEFEVKTGWWKRVSALPHEILAEGSFIYVFLWLSSQICLLCHYGAILFSSSDSRR